MRAALDSTAIMLSKDLSSGIITTSQIDAKAQSYFAALYTNTDAQSVSISATHTASNGSMGSTIQVNDAAEPGRVRVSANRHADRQVARCPLIAKKTTTKKARPLQPGFLILENSFEFIRRQRRG